MSEQLNNRSDGEKSYLTTTIEELLPRYTEAYGGMIHYETERSLPIDGHDTAWMKYTGQTSNGEFYEGHAFHCACHFAEGVGWREDEKYGVTGLSAEDECLPRKVALYLRTQELQKEYIERFSDGAMFTDTYGLWDHIPEIMLDLIEKDKAGEFIGEGSEGAHFWGGHFYLQTVNAVTEIPYDKLWDQVNAMVQDKKIQIEGMVVQEYREAPAPQWDEYHRLEYEGYTGIALLPVHSKMPQIWQITILAPNGRLLAEGIEGPALEHSPDFGPDVDDVASVEASIREVIDQYLYDPMSQA